MTPNNYKQAMMCRLGRKFSVTSRQCAGNGTCEGNKTIICAGTAERNEVDVGESGSPLS